MPRWYSVARCNLCLTSGSRALTSLYSLPKGQRLPVLPAARLQGALHALPNALEVEAGIGEDENERECVAAARRVFQLSLTASSLALDLQRLELACAFLLTDRLWAVAMADLAQLAPDASAGGSRGGTLPETAPAAGRRLQCDQPGQ
ncbi:hypothetical protein HaLaN_23371 [Haematococcus lacustris]|uniref:Uncharacterized protein n=1 Tax=Haematococcus lacustris TaxID=44745 RepID=A0A699ZRJ7_HAELA|nr:hypothetical protein HaLaN_23371 [Haematococcus lacustris]